VITLSESEYFGKASTFQLFLDETPQDFMTIREIPENSTLTLKKKPVEVKEPVAQPEEKKEDSKIDS
jgi:hypothetical protein